ncbi:MAG TPA: hypothetical protein VHO24_01045 [Opitutaceae bacterium]|nr:hypothetical protein [Opitutaceae bacterium]
MHRSYLSSRCAPWLGIAAALLAVPPVLACSCVPPPLPLEAAARATVVFVGKPVAELPGSKNISYARKFEFAVEEILAGTSKATLMVSTGRDSAACGCHFEIGVSYLVYAHGEVTALQTNLCTRTKRLDAKGAADEVALLREAKTGKTPAK